MLLQHEKWRTKNDKGEARRTKPLSFYFALLFFVLSLKQLNAWKRLFERLTNLPSVTMMCIVHTSDSCNKAIVETLVIHSCVIVIHVMTAPSTVAIVIRNGTVSTLKIVNAIFFAIPVDAAPIHYRVAFQERTKNTS